MRGNARFAFFLLLLSGAALKRRVCPHTPPSPAAQIERKERIKAKKARKRAELARKQAEEEEKQARIAKRGGRAPPPKPAAKAAAQVQVRTLPPK